MSDMKGVIRIFDADISSAIASTVSKVSRHFAPQPELVADLERQLKRKIYDLSYRTVVGLYQAKFSEQTFEDFTEALTTAKGSAYLSGMFPVLIDIVTSEIARFSSEAALILHRFAEDASDIGQLTGDSVTGETLRRLTLGLGDLHRGGQSVSSLEFEDGTRVVYKPRPLDTDLALAKLFAFVGEASGIDQRLPKLVRRPAYGWVEFIPYVECKQPEELVRYYRRVGALVGILYAINAFDFHYENLISCGEFPILVDCETLFHPHSRIFATETNTGIDDSVLMVGILPVRVTLGNGKSADIGGVTDVSTQDSAIEQLVLSQDESGKFSFARKIGKLQGGSNVPTYEGRLVTPASEHVEAILDGLSATYKAIVADKEGFIECFEHFENAEIRVLFRATITYSHLIEESLHPTLLRSKERYDAHFGGLSVLSKGYRLGQEILDFELDALQERDVPYFSCTFGNNDLIANDRMRKPDFFLENGKSLAVKKVRAMDEDDLQNQLWIARKALEISRTELTESNQLQEA